MTYRSSPQAFIPRGYVALSIALQRYSIKWFQDNVQPILNEANISGMDGSSEEGTLLSDAGGRFIEKHFFCQDSSSETWEHFRQALYEGDLTARSISMDGELKEIPSRYWGSAGAARVCETGEIEGIEKLNYAGRVLIPQQDLDDFLEGRPRPAKGGPPPQGLVVLAPSDPETVSAYLPLGYLGIKEAVKAFLDRMKATPPTGTQSGGKRRSPHGLRDAAHEEARRALASGALPSFHRQMFEGVIRPLKSSDWLPDGAVLVKCMEHFDYRRSWTSNITISVPEGSVSGEIIVRTEDLLLLFKSNEKPEQPALKLIHSEQSEAAADRNVGGRPRDFDAEAFLIEAFCIMYEGKSPPQSQSELITTTISAYRKRFNPLKDPSESWAKARIAPLWRRLKSDQKGQQPGF